MTGELNGWTVRKDVDTETGGHLDREGWTNAIIEYFGPGTASLSATGKATICNMGAEVGATVMDQISDKKNKRGSMGKNLVLDDALKLLDDRARQIIKLRFSRARHR